MPPAIYVDAGTYRTLTGNKATGTSADLDTDLALASRLIDKELGVAPGMFAPIASTAFVFDAHGGTRLYLRDAAGQQYFLRTITTDSLKIDTDADGAYDDYLLDFADAWVRGLPQNAVTLGEAFTSIELLALSSATVTKWPNAPASVQITGTWGQPAVPGIIQTLVIDIVRNLRQAVPSGALGMPAMDDSLPLSNAMWPVLRRAREQYSHRLPAVA